MRDIILQCAGVAGIVVSIIHGVLGETKVFARATIQPESLRILNLFRCRRLLPDPFGFHSFPQGYRRFFYLGREYRLPI